MPEPPHPDANQEDRFNAHQYARNAKTCRGSALFLLFGVRENWGPELLHHLLVRNRPVGSRPAAAPTVSVLVAERPGVGMSLGPGQFGRLAALFL
jgi:hypothetical protein